MRRGARARGQWSVVSGQWSVVSGQWSVVSGQWSVVSGQWSVVSGQWSVVSGQWSVVSGQWSVVSGQWSVVSGQWSVVSGQWSVVSEKRKVEDLIKTAKSPEEKAKNEKALEGLKNSKYVLTKNKEDLSKEQKAKLLQIEDEKVYKFRLSHVERHVAH